MSKHIGWVLGGFRFQVSSFRFLGCSLGSRAPPQSVCCIGLRFTTIETGSMKCTGVQGSELSSFVKGIVA